MQQLSKDIEMETQDLVNLRHLKRKQKIIQNQVFKTPIKDDCSPYEKEIEADKADISTTMSRIKYYQKFEESDHKEDSVGKITQRILMDLFVHNR